MRWQEHRILRSGKLVHFSPRSTWFHMNFNNIIVFHPKASRGFRWTYFITIKGQYNLFRITSHFLCICFNNPFKLVILQRIEKGVVKNTSIQYDIKRNATLKRKKSHIRNTNHYNISNKSQQHFTSILIIKIPQNITGLLSLWLQ